MLLEWLLKRWVSIGTLTIVQTDRTKRVIRGQTPGTDVTIQLHDPRFTLRFLANPSIALGEGYMNGSWSVVDGDLYSVLRFVGENIERAGYLRFHGTLRRLETLFRKLHQNNYAKKSQSNVEHHYDLSDELYDLFLDSDRQYSCAYYTGDENSLESAQLNKKQLIAKKMVLQPGQHVLDIGCGWGGMAIFLAQEYDVYVTGLTLSQQQLSVARKRAQDAGLSDRVQFHLRDYRDEHGQYDRIVSVGMFEHVGTKYFPTFFSKVRDLLHDDGVALLHTIGRMEVPAATDAWVRKHIFPGGYIPALSEIASAVEQTELWMTDVEILRLHYAETLSDWRNRFLERRDEVARMYDERFCRMWEYYLSISEVSFRHLRNAVFHVQLTKEQTAVPLTRDYLWNTGSHNQNTNDIIIDQGSLA